MNYTFLISPVTIELIALIIFAVLLGGWLLVRKTKQSSPSPIHLSDKIESKAIILTVEETGTYVDHQPQVKMQMQVIPEKGRNFVVEVKEFLPVIELAAIRSGSTVIVRYNPANNKEIRLVRKKLFS